MSILNFYQLALVSTIVATVVAANWVRKQKGVVLMAQVIPVPQEPTLVSKPITSEPSLKTIVPELRKLATPIADSVKERIQALDKLFDENVISVDEYVELRKRALG